MTDEKLAKCLKLIDSIQRDATQSEDAEETLFAIVMQIERFRREVLNGQAR